MFVGLYDELVKWKNGVTHWKLRWKIAGGVLLMFIVATALFSSGIVQFITETLRSTNEKPAQSAQPAQTAQGDNNKLMLSTGSNSPVTYVEKAYYITYDQFIAQETAKTDNKDLVDDESIEKFFNSFQIALANKRKSLTANELNAIVPGYLKAPYDINVTVSSTHGIGYEFITPSENPEINVIRTKMPIEKYYFSKFTNNLDYSNAELMKLGKIDTLIDLVLIGGKDLLAVKNDRNVLLVGIGIKYAQDDSMKEIGFLRIFGNNQKNFWTSMNPEDEVNFLYNRLNKYHQF
jgi:hypothetical protein